MDTVVAMLGILGALFLGAASPGPSFIVVSRTAVSQSRQAGLAAALGMGAGGMVFSVLALLGIGALLHGHPRLFQLISVAGGLYLLHLAYRLIRTAKRPLAVGDGGVPATARAKTAFLNGFGVQISNPKTAIVYAGIFASLLPADTGGWFFLILPPLVFLVEASWYSGVALLFSSGSLRTRYLDAKAWIDAGAGLVIGALGGHVILKAAGALLHSA